MSESGAVFANQANQANQPWSLLAKRISRVSEPSAVYFLKFALMGICERSGLREGASELRERVSLAQSSQIKQTKPSAVFANQANQANLANQANRASRASESSAVFANQANQAKRKTTCAYTADYDPPSPTGREGRKEGRDPKSCFKFT